MKRERMLAICLAALLLAGCGGGSAGGAAEDLGDSTASPSEGAENGWDMGAAEDFAPAPEAPQGTTGSVYQNPNAKLIRRAELSIQTEQFDQSVQTLKQMVSGCGGYFENAAEYGGGQRDAYASRWGEYVVRVPAERYNEFFNSAGDLGYVTSSVESSDDVGERYYDMEARLKTQRTKQERLLELLERAESMEDIIALESALSEVEYQIEQYSSELKRYDALINFATFTITLNEVGRVNQEVGETSPLGQRMVAGFQSSFRGLVRGGQDFLIWVSYHLFLIVILAALGTAGVIVCRRELKKRKKQRENNEEK